MLTWDEAKEAVNKAQSTNGEDFERHLADYMVQGVVQKLMTTTVISRYVAWPILVWT